ncbi:MAG: hypothetical protein GX660_03705 [Clostridiaceae bacterium]|nr:hypothetical protein [Clostridiaceae bacterium]
MMDFDRDFNNQFKQAKRSMVGIGVVGVILKLVFWLGLIAGALYLLYYFGVI